MNKSYRNCLPISDRKTDEQYRMELLLRLLITEHINWSKISQYQEFSELLDKETIGLCENKLDYESIKERFTTTFNLLYNLLGESTFKKYSNNKYQGPVLASAFQVIATGVFINISEIMLRDDRNEWIKEKVPQIYEEEIFKKNTIPGVKAIPRYKDLSEFGIEYFKS